MTAPKSTSIRLDKFLSQSTELSRSQAKKVLHRSEITINGNIVKDGSVQVDVDNDTVEWLDEELYIATGFRYLLLYKPDGFECSLKPKHHPSVVELIAVPQVDKLRMAGRLDVDTTGLLLLSDDGGWLHRVTSPKHKHKKLYEVTLSEPMTPEQQADAIRQVQAGILLDSETEKTKPAELSFIDETHANLVLIEGKYHQVKRMFAALGNHVEALHRSQLDSLNLEGLEMGECRELSETEVALF